MGVPALPPALLYIGPQGGRRPWEINLPRGAAAKGGGVPPTASGAPPHLGFPTLGAGGRPMGGAPAHYGLVPLPLQPMGPFGTGGPTGWTPGTLPVVPVLLEICPRGNNKMVIIVFPCS